MIGTPISQNQGQSERKEKSSIGSKRRRGALLLDLFLATLIFSGAMIVLANQGSRSLALGSRAAMERLAWIEAESCMTELSARPIVTGKRTSDIAALEKQLRLEVDCQELDRNGFYLIQIEVFDGSQSSNSMRRSEANPLVVLRRYVYQDKAAKP